jgi:transposase
VPTLHKGRIVVMDNLSAHRPKRIRELLESRGCELLYLPSYSPDYNPIEEAFAKIKDLLGKAAATTKEALVEAIGVEHCRRLVPKTLGASSSTLATIERFSYCEKHAVAVVCWDEIYDLGSLQIGLLDRRKYAQVRP